MEGRGAGTLADVGVGVGREGGGFHKRGPILACFLLSPSPTDSRTEGGFLWRMEQGVQSLFYCKISLAALVCLPPPKKEEGLWEKNGFHDGAENLLLFLLQLFAHLF